MSGCSIELVTLPDICVPPRVAGSVRPAARHSLFCGPVDKLLKQFSQSLTVPELAFPDEKDFPAHCFERCDMGPIPHSVTLELWLPKFHPTLWHRRESASRIWMLVPETTVDKYGETPTSEHYVGCPGQFPRVKAVPITHRVQKPPDQQFRLCVLSANAGHHPGAGLRINYVGHTVFPGPLVSAW